MTTIKCIGILTSGGDAPGMLFLRTVPATYLRITDAQGRLVHQQRLATQAEGSRVSLPLQHVNPGIYIVTLHGSYMRIIERMIR